MDCREAQDLMHAYADHELDLVRTLDIERHIHECQTCAQAHKDLARLRSSLSNSGLYFKAPPGLEQRIRKELRKAQPKPIHRSIARFWLPIAVAASLAVVAISIWAVLRGPGLSSERLLADAVVSGHVRSLMAAHLFDVESTNEHNVKPWFDGKIDFAPDVRNFPTDSFPLAGGRLDYLADRPVAALVYRHDKHYINLFIWPVPNEADRSPTATVQQGYQVIHWTRAHMNYWAVSDTSRQNLQRFVDLVDDQKKSGGELK